MRTKPLLSLFVNYLKFQPVHKYIPCDNYNFEIPRAAAQTFCLIYICKLQAKLHVVCITNR